MKHPLMSVLLISLSVLGSVSRHASAADLDRSESRETRQETRISEGVQNGSLTPLEASRLQKRENRIDNMQANASRDGRVSKREAARIERAQDQANNAIHRQKHDKQHR